MRSRSRFALTIVVTLTLVAATWGCEAALVPGNPELPAGFADAPIPQVPFNVYLYVNPGKTITFPTSHFLDEELPEGAALPPLAEEVGLDAFRMWARPTVDSYGALFDFTAGPEAQLISQVLELRQGGLEDVWQHQEADHLVLAKGSDPWTESLRTAIEEDRMVTIQEEYPDVWETIRMLPENPPSSPMAAGFLRMDGELMEAIATKVGIEGRGLTPATGFIRISAIAFAVYSDVPLNIAQEVDQDYLAQAQLGGVFVARSGYPGFLLSLVFNVLEGRSPLEQVSLGDDITAYYLSLDKLHALISHRGSLVFGSLASSRERAEELLVSALGTGG